MNTRIIAFGCAVFIGACGGESPPPREPVASSVQPSVNTPAATSTAPVDAPRNDTPKRTDQPSSVPATDIPSTTANSNPGVADQTKNADNTTINDRDRHATVTPLDQGNSSTETKITAAIRKGIMAEKGLSFNAKNVKVITVGSKVTLRGPVASDQERATIEALAKKTEGVSIVDNQLEVKK